MNEYLKPSVFWSLVGLSTMLFLLCLLAGMTWQPFIVGVVVAASVVEWGIEQRWPDQLRVMVLYWQIGWIDGELQMLRREMNEARSIGDEDEAQTLQFHYVEVAKRRRRLSERLGDLRYALEGAVEGVDYPVS